MTTETWGRLLQEDGDTTVFVPLTAPAPTPDPGAAPFRLSPQVAARVSAVAGRRQVSGDAWLEQHLRTYFGIR